jgi:hypothetical protein
MSIVALPGLKKMIEEISQTHNLPKSAVQQALREALLKGYERYRRAQRLDRHHFEASASCLPNPLLKKLATATIKFHCKKCRKSRLKRNWATQSF